SMYSCFLCYFIFVVFFFSSRRRHTRSKRDWSSDVCSSDLAFSFNMFIIAFMLKVYANLPEAFMFLWVTSGLSEFITMILCIPIMYYLNKRLNFARLI